jgi:hypothetical protein
VVEHALDDEVGVTVYPPVDDVVVGAEGFGELSPPPDTLMALVRFEASWALLHSVSVALDESGEESVGSGLSPNHLGEDAEVSTDFDCASDLRMAL